LVTAVLETDPAAFRAAEVALEVCALDDLRTVTLDDDLEVCFPRGGVEARVDVAFVCFPPRAPLFCVTPFLEAERPEEAAFEVLPAGVLEGDLAPVDLEVARRPAPLEVTLGATFDGDLVPSRIRPGF